MKNLKIFLFLKNLKRKKKKKILNFFSFVETQKTPNSESNLEKEK